MPTETTTPPPAVDKRGERVKAMFAGVAKRYDLLNHLLSLNIDRRWRRFTVRKVPPKGTLPILDICTGTGDLALGYANTADAPKVIGADFCREMLVIAQQKARKQNLPVEFLEGDATELPFCDNQFQIVSVAFGLRNVSDTHKGLSEMIRVAAPGGRVAILEFSRPRVPVLRTLYLVYFKYLLPRIGQSVSKSSHDAYHYLPASVLSFPDGEEMCRLLRDMGLTDVERHPLTFGVATLYIGRKPE